MTSESTARENKKEETRTSLRGPEGSDKQRVTSQSQVIIISFSRQCHFSSKFLSFLFSFKPRSERSQRKTSRRNLIFSSCPSWAHRRKWYNFHATDISSLYMFINYLTLFQLLEGTTRARFCNAGNLNHRRPRRFSQELTDKFAQRKEKGETNFKYEEKKPPISRTRTMFRS